MKQLCLGILLLAMACKKMDDYKKWGDGGEIRYPATLDSLKVIPGNHRVMISGLLVSDPGVTKFRVFWNSGNDSLESPISRSGTVDTIRQIIDNLPEGPMTFVIRTYDDAGNKSIPMNITGNVYGESFQHSVNLRGNRVVLDSKLNMDGSATISWANTDAYVGVLGMRMRYFDAWDNARDTVVRVQLQDQETILPAVSIQKPVSFNTLYLPEPVGIDTFTVASKELDLFNEVALLNAAFPVANSANDGNRWATPRDWITNDAARNHNGYGGTSTGDKKIYFEAGWGAPAIENGKIYQVANLAPGKYSFEGSVDWFHQGSRNDVYLVVMPGDAGLPDVDNLGSALAYKKLDNGSYIDLPFEITEPSTVSIGLLLYMNDDGEAIRFNYLKLSIKP